MTLINQLKAMAKHNHDDVSVADDAAYILTVFKNALEIIASDKAEWDEVTPENEADFNRMLAKLALDEYK